ncbi:MAG: LemA family protein, partial [Nostoc sp.]
NFLELQNELANTEDRIQAALRFYNGNVRENNSSIRQFPSNIVAALFGFKRRDFFQIQNTAAKLPPVVQF